MATEPLAAMAAAFIIASCVVARTASASRPDIDPEALLASTGPVAADTLPPEEEGASRAKKDVIYAIGDSHGDENYLVRSLLATGLFALEGTHLEWAGMADPEVKSCEVVVMGDFVDQGTYSKENALLLKRLQGETPAAITFTVLMGNHESTLLYRKHLYKGSEDERAGDGIHREEDWSGEERFAALKARAGEDADLFGWISELPAVRLVSGVLLVHGGISGEVAARVAAEVACGARGGAACGAAATAAINAAARAYYRNLHECMQGQGPTVTWHEAIKACNETNPLPYMLAWEERGHKGEGGGVHWFRGYALRDSGAGSRARCEEADGVAGQFGAQRMVVAHITHTRITEYCKERDFEGQAEKYDGATRVYAVDAHFLGCYKTGECDFGTDKAHRFHEGQIDGTKANVPQALKLVSTDSEEGRVFSTPERCLSEVGDAVEVACEMMV